MHSTAPTELFMKKLLPYQSESDSEVDEHVQQSYEHLKQTIGWRPISVMGSAIS